MSILTISEDDFNDFNVLKHPAASVFATEKGWFKDSKNKLLGVIVKDNIDSDWVAIVLGLHEDSSYRAIQTLVSLTTIDKAESALLESMTIILKEGKAEEKLFLAETQIIKEYQIPIIKDINDEIKTYLKKHPEKLYQLTPRRFEELIASIFTDLGFNTELTKATRDGGRDIIASIRTEVSTFLAYIECKKYSPENKVGVGIIREVSGVHYIRKPSKSIIVTTSFFSPDAKIEAKTLENQLDLKDYNDIKTWLEKY